MSFQVVGGEKWPEASGDYVNTKTQILDARMIQAQEGEGGWVAIRGLEAQGATS